MSKALERRIAPLLVPEPPWITGIKADADVLAATLRGAGVLPIVCDGAKMRGRTGFIAELADEFRFPRGAPKSLDAVIDWLTDLSWLGHPGPYACVVRHGRSMLAAAGGAELERCHGTLDVVGRMWSDPRSRGVERDEPLGVAFHTVLLP